MRSNAAEPSFGGPPGPSHFRFGADDASELAAAVTHQVAEAVMEVIGSLFWTRLAAGYLTAALGPQFQ
jgi:hypothetical protein